MEDASGAMLTFYGPTTKKPKKGKWRQHFMKLSSSFDVLEELQLLDSFFGDITNVVS